MKIKPVAPRLRYTAKTVIGFSDEEKAKYKLKAQEKGMTLNAFIRLVLREHVFEKDEDGKP